MKELRFGGMELTLRLKQQFYYYDTNRLYDHPSKFNFHVKILTNSIVEEYVSKKNEANDYVLNIIRQYLIKKFDIDSIAEVEVSDTNFYSLFLRLRNKSAIISVPVDYDDAGIQLSGSQKFSYPEGSDKRAKPEDQQGGAYYKADLYPNMPKKWERRC